MTRTEYFTEVFISVYATDLGVVIGLFLYGIYQFINFIYTRSYGTRTTGTIVDFHRPPKLFFTKPIVEFIKDGKRITKTADYTERDLVQKRKVTRLFKEKSVLLENGTPIDLIVMPNGKVIVSGLERIWLGLFSVSLLINTSILMLDSFFWNVYGVNSAIDPMTLFLLSCAILYGLPLVAKTYQLYKF
jgi:hypothetical protein